MAPGNEYTDRVKLDELVRLAREQVAAIEQGDKKGLDRILAAKRAVIGSFTDARSMVEAEPALQGIVREVQECDQAAQQLLYRRIGRVMGELSELQQAKKARHAYYTAKSAAARKAYPFQADTPRFIDHQS